MTKNWKENKQVAISIVSLFLIVGALIFALSSIGSNKPQTTIKQSNQNYLSQVHNQNVILMRSQNVPSINQISNQSSNPLQFILGIIILLFMSLKWFFEKTWPWWLGMAIWNVFFLYLKEAVKKGILEAKEELKRLHEDEEN